MNYNELKIRILGLFEPTQELESLKIRKLLATEKTVKLTDKAVEMALLRYWRQGLLSRTRRALESDPPSGQVPIRSNRTRPCSKRVVAQEWM